MVATKDSHVIYTDVWVSMGEPEDVWKERIADLTPYRVTKSIMENAGPQCRFMHCLPAYRDYEVVPAVIDGPRSVIFDEAENRLHAQKAVMVKLMRG